MGAAPAEFANQKVPARSIAIALESRFADTWAMQPILLRAANSALRRQCCRGLGIPTRDRQCWRKMGWIPLARLPLN
jgi:hypothetical protein